MHQEHLGRIGCQPVLHEVSKPRFSPSREADEGIAHQGAIDQRAVGVSSGRLVQEGIAHGEVQPLHRQLRLLRAD